MGGLCTHSLVAAIWRLGNSLRAELVLSHVGHGCTWRGHPPGVTFILPGVAIVKRHCDELRYIGRGPQLRSVTLAFDNADRSNQGVQSLR